jgi:hypothetical protein
LPIIDGNRTYAPASPNMLQDPEVVRGLDLLGRCEHGNASLLTEKIKAHKNPNKTAIMQIIDYALRFSFFLPDKIEHTFVELNACARKIHYAEFYETARTSSIHPSRDAAVSLEPLPPLLPKNLLGMFYKDNNASSYKDIVALLKIKIQETGGSFPAELVGLVKEMPEEESLWLDFAKFEFRKWYLANEHFPEVKNIRESIDKALEETDGEKFMEQYAAISSSIRGVARKE